MVIRFPDVSQKSSNSASNADGCISAFLGLLVNYIQEPILLAL